MLCPNCHKEVAEGVLKCPFCDANLSSESVAQEALPTVEEATAVSETVQTESVTEEATTTETVTEEATEEVTETAETVESVSEVTVGSVSENNAEIPKAEEQPVAFTSSEDFFKKYNLFNPEAIAVTATSEAKPSAKRKKPILLIVIIVLAVLIGALATVFVLMKNNGEAVETSSEKGDDTMSASVEDTPSEDGVVSDEGVSSGENVTSEEDTSSEPHPSELNNETVVGDWGFSVSFKEMSEATGENLGFETDATYKLYLRLNADKTVQLVCTTEDYKSTNSAYSEDYFAYLRNGGYYELREKEGYSKEQVDKMLADAGMTVDLLIDGLEAEMKNKNALEGLSVTEDGYVLLSDTETVTKYSLETNKMLFVTDEDLTRETYISFEYKDGVITVLEGTYAKGVLVEKSLVKK